MGWNITSDPHWVCPYVATHTGGSYSTTHSTALGLVGSDDGLVAGVVFENWNKRSITAHMAITGRLTRAYIGAIFRYAFHQCGVGKVILPVSSGNLNSIRFVTHLGFSEEARIKDADPLGDIIIFTLTKSACRFLGEKFHGQTIASPRA